MTNGAVKVTELGSIIEIVFDRPRALNAMTWDMYEQLSSVCDRIAASSNVKLVVFRGGGNRAFVAGTDITQFKGFDDTDGIEYEARLEGILHKLENVRVSTVAVLQGYVTGGGLAIAATCDFRFATPDVVLGMPIAYTVGNCLSISNLARLSAWLGYNQVRTMILSGEFLSADVAGSLGLVTIASDVEDMERQIEKLQEKLETASPNTIYATKEALRRLIHAGVPDDADLIRHCYGSSDFGERVNRFIERQKTRST